MVKRKGNRLIANVTIRVTRHLTLFHILKRQKVKLQRARPRALFKQRRVLENFAALSIVSAVFFVSFEQPCYEAFILGTSILSSQVLLKLFPGRAIQKHISRYSYHISLVVARTYRQIISLYLSRICSNISEDILTISPSQLLHHIGRYSHYISIVLNVLVNDLTISLSNLPQHISKYLITAKPRTLDWPERYQF